MNKIDVRKMLKTNCVHDVVPLTVILGTRSQNKIGQLNTIDNDIVYNPKIQDSYAISFTLHKTKNGVECNHWDDVVDFKLIYVKEYDEWFQIQVTINDSDITTKKINGTPLCSAELSQTLLRNIEINTSTDTARSDYTAPTVFYNASNPSISLLNRVLSKNKSYTIKHVDETLCNLQRTFSIDGKSVYDFLTSDLSTEIGCLFLFDSIDRSISVYDLYTTCLNTSCNYRGEYDDVCPKCGGTNLKAGYGEDTSIYISKENLGTEIDFSSNTDSMKNCFKVIGGDDLMTSTVAMANPNGSPYLYVITSDMKADMSTELVEKLDAYDTLTEYYKTTNVVTMPTSDITKYNTIVDNIVSMYPLEANEFSHMTTTFTGFPALITAYEDTMSMIAYLTDEMMPTLSVASTTAAKQLALLTTANLSPVAVTSTTNLTITVANNAVLAMAKANVNTSIYKVEISSSALSGTTWNGKFKLTNYSDDTDTATNTVDISVAINTDETTYINQVIKKAMANVQASEITSLVSIDISDTATFNAALKKFCQNSLSNCESAYQTALTALQEQKLTSDQKTSIYTPYFNRLSAVQSELATRNAQISDVTALKAEFSVKKAEIQTALNFEKYLGTDLSLEFEKYRREDDLKNENYSSDGLNNAQLIQNAEKLIEWAQTEAKKSSEKQNTITATLRNLLLLRDEKGNLVFEPLLDKFQLGNFIRVRVDKDLYKLRLVGIQIDYSKLESLSVTFSDVVRATGSIGRASKILNAASTMATTYSATQNQAASGATAAAAIDTIKSDGIDTTNIKIASGATNQKFIIDNNGLLIRQYDDINAKYSDEQIRLFSQGLLMTDDAFASYTGVIGKFTYTDPTTNEVKTTWGINAETLKGDQLIGDNLTIRNSSATFKVDKDGVYIKGYVTVADLGGSGTTTINGDNITTGSITSNNYAVDSDGKITAGTKIKLLDGTINTKNFTLASDGSITATNGTFTGKITAGTGSYIGGFNIHEAVSGKYLETDENSSGYTTGFGTGDDWAFWSGFNKTTGKANYQVTQDGTLNCSKLNATGGMIGKWNIDNALYSDYSVSNLEKYRVYLFPYQADAGINTWVFSIQHSVDGGSTYNSLMRILGNGDVYAHDTHFNNAYASNFTTTGKVAAVSYSANGFDGANGLIYMSDGGSAEVVNGIIVNITHP